MKLSRVQLHLCNKARCKKGGMTMKVSDRLITAELAVMAANARAEKAHRLFSQREKFTVSFGLERGLRDPLIGLQVMIHPMEFKYLAAIHGGDVVNLSALADRVGRETGAKVSRALVEFVDTFGTRC